MTIPQKMLEKWQLLRSPSDTTKLAEKMTDGYPEIFNRAFRDGKCNDEVFAIMKDFYTKKAELIKEVL